MRGAALALLVAAGLGTCASGSAGIASETSLRVTYWADGIARTDEPVTWTLRCNPPRGMLARPAVACRRLSARGRALFAPVPESAVCTEIYGGPQIARVVGRLAGGRIWATFARENGCQVARWDRLAPWLLPAAGSPR